MHYKDAQAAWTPSAPLVLVHNADAEETFEQQAARKTKELRQLSEDIRQLRQTENALQLTRDRVAAELETLMRAINRRNAK